MTRRMALLGGAALMMASTAAVRAAETQVLGGPAFGSYWRLALSSEANAAAVREAVIAVVAAIDGTMSPYRPSSDLTRFNRARTTEPVQLPEPLCGLLGASLRIAAMTGGEFDPTVGPIVGRYGFGPIIDGATAGSYRELVVEAGTIRKTIPDLTIDLCGIAKGYALDRIALALAAIGMQDFLLELGGEVLARGAHPAGRPWRVGVENPLGPPAAIAHVVRPTTLAMATSGPAIQSYEVDGRLYSHVIDPRLREPADGSIASVTVLMATGTEADAFATALMAMGADDAIVFAGRHSIPALIQLWTGSSPSERMTANFSDFLEA